MNIQSVILLSGVILVAIIVLVRFVRRKGGGGSCGCGCQGCSYRSSCGQS